MVSYVQIHRGYGRALKCNNSGQFTAKIASLEVSENVMT